MISRTSDNQSWPETPRKGFRFLHARVLDPENFDGKTPQLCEVTRVASNRVYYRPVYNYGTREGYGNPAYCDASCFSSVVLEEARNA
jgi:hypothetical protein